MANATASVLLAGARRVHLVQERPNGWSRVQVDGLAGYVRSGYLVEEQD